MIVQLKNVSKQYKDAEKSYLETIKSAKEIGDTNIQDIAFNNLAIIYEQIYRNFDAAIMYDRKIIENSKISGNVNSYILALMNLGITYSHVYDYETAYNICTQAMKKIIQII